MELKLGPISSSGTIYGLFQPVDGKEIETELSQTKREDMPEDEYFFNISFREDKLRVVLHNKTEKYLNTFQSPWENIPTDQTEQQIGEYVLNTYRSHDSDYFENEIANGTSNWTELLEHGFR